MKKIILRFFIVILILAAAYIIFNQFDIAEVKTEFTGKTEVGILGKPDYSKENGFYRLLSLSEPEDVDVESDEIYMKYRKLHDPQYDNKLFIKQYKRLKSSIDKLKTLSNKLPGGIFNIDLNNADWCKRVLKEKKTLLELKSPLSLLLNRYTRLLNSMKLNDFTNLTFIFDDDNKEYSSIPNLLTWLKLAKLYNVLNALDALEGNWERSIKNLIIQINFSKKLARTNKVLITNLITRAVMSMSIKTINTLFNEKNCPIEMFDLILEMDNIEYEEYGNERAILSEFVFAGGKDRSKKFTEGIEFFENFLFQKNRTFKIIIDSVSNYLKFDKEKPYLWSREFDFSRNQKKGLFWWLQNPIGKTIVAVNSTNFQHLLHGSYSLKAQYDIFKISAELRKNYTGEKSVEDLLNTLKSYRTLMDPCSGKPYKWNKKNQLLYGIGIDRKDDEGKSNFSMDTDIPLHIVLYVR